MTTTAPVTGTTPTTSTANSTNNVAMQQLSGNFNTFLTLLTTQLQNQDPTSPMDSNQFTEELVQFSQVEQQINTNSNLQTLINQGQSASGAYAMSYLGHDVTISNGEGALTNGEANWNYTLGANAAVSTLSVTDSSGNTVYTASGNTAAGSYPFSWNGENASGTQLPDGTYTLTVSAQDSTGAAVTTGVTSTGVVNEVNLSGAAPTLMIGAMSVPLTAVSNVANPTTATN
jgi:flagellar basal-body rod modification protein FlgD